MTDFIKMLDNNSDEITNMATETAQKISKLCKFTNKDELHISLMLLLERFEASFAFAMCVEEQKIQQKNFPDERNELRQKLSWRE